MATKIFKFGNSAGLIIPAFAARSLAFKPGTFVRLVVLERELRVRLASAPLLDDPESYEAFREAELKRSLPEKW